MNAAKFQTHKIDELLIETFISFFIIDWINLKDGEF